MPATAPYGSWASPIAADDVARGGVRLAEPWPAPDGSTWWLERRPAEGGRSVVVRDGRDVTPKGFNARTRVHEYGGGAWLVVGDAVVFSNFEDQRLYRQELGGGGEPGGAAEPGAAAGAPRAITPEPAQPGALRYADGRPTPDGSRIVCVRESHVAGEEPRNELVILSANGSAEPEPFASGRDFYAFPRISPDGTRVAFTCWDHPNMPWDGTELWVAPLDHPASAVKVAGGPDESIWQPEWSPDGRLHWVSDADGYWNLHNEHGQLTHERADLGYPQWVFGGSTYAFLDDGSMACVRVDRGVERLHIARGGELEELDLPYTAYVFPALHSDGKRLVFVAGSPSEDAAVVELDPATTVRKVLKSASDDPIDPAYTPQPEQIEFATGGGATAHAFYYPPKNPGFEGPEGERPPLIVQSHGGPTGHVCPELQADIVFWTSRGFGIVDVNYRGSTGFGRDYRRALDGVWGIADTEDCIAAARHLADGGEVDGSKLAIHGGSAGGYTTLCALVFHDDFAAGASYYGVADAETLARDSHKFESRYLDRLIGPYPEARETYRERSPIHFVERLRSPVILLQGLEDEIVPPSQAEAMAAALKANGVPHAYLAFAGEQHGFRKAETIARCLEAELSFYAQIFGFEPSGEIEPVKLAH